MAGNTPLKANGDFNLSVTAIKRRLQGVLQRALGIGHYLFFFAVYTTATWRLAEPAFFRFLRLIPNSGVIIDVGANLGVTACYFARRKPDSQVFAFEPIPWNVRTIRRMIAFSGVHNVSVKPYAIGNRSGEVSLGVPIVKGARMHALGRVCEGDSAGELFRVPCRRLDDLFLTNSRHISALKVDVEGFEHEVLGGALKLLQRDHPLVYCELWDNTRLQQCMELLAPLGYDIADYIGDNYIFAARNAPALPAAGQRA